MPARTVSPSDLKNMSYDGFARALHDARDDGLFGEAICCSPRQCRTAGWNPA
jgi:hypothetical protein